MLNVLPIFNIFFIITLLLFKSKPEWELQSTNHLKLRGINRNIIQRKLRLPWKSLVQINAWLASLLLCIGCWVLIPLNRRPRPFEISRSSRLFSNVELYRMNLKEQIPEIFCEVFLLVFHLIKKALASWMFIHVFRTIILFCFVDKSKFLKDLSFSYLPCRCSILWAHIRLWFW